MKEFSLIIILSLATMLVAQGQSTNVQQAAVSSGATKSEKTPTTRAPIVLPPEKANPSSINLMKTPPVIDGKLDDEAWKSATVLKDFYQTSPGDNIAPSKPTEVFLGYDSKFLYIAFHAFDEPGKVRATVAKRDDIFQDDYVGIYLDTYNDQRKAYELFFNPFGIQADGIFAEGRGEDLSVVI